MLRTCILLFSICSLFAGEVEPAPAPAPVALDEHVLADRSPLIAALAVPAGAWQDAKVTPPDRAADRKAIAAAGDRFLASVKAAKDGPSIPAQRALAVFVKKLSSDAKQTKADDYSPEFARRAVRGGTLRTYGADQTAVTALEKAVTDACTLQPVNGFDGPQKAHLEERRDAFGVGGWVLVGDRTAMAVPHLDPQFARAPSLILVVDLPAKADPARDVGKAISASVLSGTKTLATWTAKDDKLVSDLTTWRSVVKEANDPTAPRGLLPPHIVICDLDGDLIRLVTMHGSVTPARNSTPAESERFLTETTKALPDTVSLDLIGEYMFTYVYDSPDPRFPWIIGTSDIKGDIHQTAAQTIGSTTGGQCRGDCDDLAEFYQTMAERQGRFGHLLVLPGHTAFGSAHKEGTDWVVEVMQTGPTESFRDPDVRNALRAAHASFDPTAPFSPDQVGLLLRFSGENTRGGFVLGWRIFTEEAYAKTMIDVQRDWQYQTYARALAKMDKLITSGDKDPANISERAGLLRATGQWDAAAAAYREVVAAVEDPVSKFQERMNLAGILRHGGHADEAKKVLQDIVASQDELKAKIGNGFIEISMRLSQAMLGAGDKEGARKVFGPAFGVLAQMTMGIAQKNIQPSAWSDSAQYAAIRRLEMTFAGCLIAHLEHAGESATKDPTLVSIRQVLDLWLAKIAFLDAPTPTEAVRVYATAARIHALDMKHDALVDAVMSVKPASSAKKNFMSRAAGPAAATRDADLPWIRISPYFWLGEVSRALRGKDDDDQDESDVPSVLDPTKVDHTRLTDAVKHVSESLELCRKLGIIDESLDTAEHTAVLMGALASGDDKALRERLRFVKKEDDKRLRDSTAMIIGQLAPLCDDKQWQAVLKAWSDEVDYKPKWFSIAWQAAISGAPKQALATAHMAATRFKDDTSFTEEAQFMEKLLAPKKEAAAH